MYEIDVHPEVYSELEHSRSWYEERARNLGTEFLVEVDRAIQRVQKSPDTWPYLDTPNGIRRYLVHRFPYGVVYRIGEETIQVVAVMHLRRYPDYWRGRISHWNGVEGAPPTSVSNKKP